MGVGAISTIRKPGAGGLDNNFNNQPHSSNTLYGGISLHVGNSSNLTNKNQNYKYMSPYQKNMGKKWSQIKMKW